MAVLSRASNRRQTRTMSLPAPLVERMVRQRGLIRRQQVLDLGVPGATLDGWLRRGELEIVQRTVYRRPGGPAPPEQQLLASVYRGGDGARATGWSACALYGLEGFDAAAKPWIAIPSHRRVRGVDFVVQRAELARGDLASVAGIPAVTPRRALIDVAVRAAPKQIRVGIDDARRRGLVDLDRLLSRASQLRRHPGAVAVRRLFGAGQLDQDGELERQLALALASVGLRPAWGMEVLPGIIADACFPEASYIVECDGRRWHTIDSDRAGDATREGVLVADGWLVDRVTDRQLRHATEQVVARIAATRAARIAQGCGRPTAWRAVRAGRRIRPPAP